MEQRQDDGGPAFPRPAQSFDSGAKGMLLRDWFAGMAIAGMAPTEQYRAVTAAAAYAMADAMLAERKKRMDGTAERRV